MLYVVATPIGHLQDLSIRAREVLSSVAGLLCEDTRHSAILLGHYGIKKPMRALHQHNEASLLPELLAELQAGFDLALLSDAGTPLVSDPGGRLVRAAAEAGIRVVPIPGASAVTAALMVAGFAADRFVFQGFLPRTAAGRHEVLQAMRREQRTMVFFEAPHRLMAMIQDATAVFGAERLACLCRELTKMHEDIRREPLGELARALANGTIPTLGECVVVVEGAPATEPCTVLDTETVWAALQKALPPSRAAALMAQLAGGSKGNWYARLHGRDAPADTEEGQEPDP
jgi:16S rRNA (cytidine1402-2'-O)-methyltransferase